MTKVRLQFSTPKQDKNVSFAFMPEFQNCFLCEAITKSITLAKFSEVLKRHQDTKSHYKLTLPSNFHVLIY